MTISIWRYSHLTLALVSSLFLIVASVTGIILAVEPISHQAKGYAVENLNEVSLATAIDALKSTYDEVLGLEVESSGFVKASVLTMEIETLDVYFNPKTGEQLGEVKERPHVYTFATNVHRSLFLKSIGRFFVGLISLLLLIIAVTGLILLAKRQGGFLKLFSKVHKDYFELRYHVVLSRWFFIPIVILAFTGVYLSAEKFNLLPNAVVQQTELAVNKTVQEYKSILDIPFFKETSLADIRQVEFPFSDDPEEYYLIALQNREVAVNQHTGEIVSSGDYPFVTLASRLSLVLHTGEGNVIWSLVLLLASASILFFMYSGFVMTLKRRKKGKRIAKMTDKDECEFVILVGSESGTAFDFAQRFYNGLVQIGKKVYLTELNKYTNYAKVKNVIVFTSTYGKGEPPTNARKFSALFSKIKQPNITDFSVIGFGSLDYPDYCQFAIELDNQLSVAENFNQQLPLFKINKSDFNSFEQWMIQFHNKVGFTIPIEKPLLKKKKYKKIEFEVLQRTDLNVDNTFLLRLQPKSKIDFTSGDLLAVFPNDDEMVRQYSIAKIDESILLSIKKHELGRGSNFLFNLKVGETLKAAIEENEDFHFSENSKNSIFISNGTGIAPFLGMISKNATNNITMFWGGREKASMEIYNSVLEKEILNNENIQLFTSFSREGKKQYVQDVVFEQKELVLRTINQGGTIMICGSLAMQHNVLDVLENLLEGNKTISFETFEKSEQLKTDCY
ncbi:PepSY domain-containing protein [Maribacter hydrothermalis]|uniref:NADPH--hemoprotein reductase n=1 Tax=Maribacter hydrothermalis TaxID=1836467 RepID=A0A1B7Z6P4_9FLAO|nr:PepSY domain-containing protein [Maribacter hydrothermalis]APQ18637.1 oxidoreductase [Maribacter hydrothermalis]OBR38371.1 oxidoreductase [Maribacter hydrothermalis]